MFLTHWSRDKIDAILQTTFLNETSCMKMFEFRLKFHWSLFLNVQSTIFQHCSDNGLAPNRRQAIIGNNDDSVQRRIFVSLGHNELKVIIRSVRTFALVMTAACLILWPPIWIIGHKIIITNAHHYSDVTMGAIASQSTGVSIVYSTVYSGVDQRKHQSSASLAFVRGIHRWPVNSPNKRPVTRKMFFHLMTP